MNKNPSPGSVSEPNSNAGLWLIPDTLTFADLFDVEKIQAIQDAFAFATGVASIITEVDGTPITRPSNFCRLCIDIIRQTEKGLINCMKSDAHLGQYNPGGPIMQPCLSGGLWDGGASICVGERHIANWLIGQVRDDSIDEERLLDYATVIDADVDEFRSAMAEIKMMPKEQFAQVCNALYLIANQLSELALSNFQQLRAMEAQKQAETERLQLQQQVIEAQRAAISELSTPIIPIMDNIIVMPLVGSIDSQRAIEVTRTILAGITQYRAKILILDITGVPVVDSGVADHLNRTIQAARLKGASTIITGITDAVAETIVDLGIEWHDLETLRDLQSGLLLALDQLGYNLRRTKVSSHR
ncbi:MAG TPA: PocR ligand-binding domain-containing protein [Phototrophicaceae bacterium]|nr:PocR ligand-binding domain-containing protein [Phototrophicaceae bacterium]